MLVYILLIAQPILARLIRIQYFVCDAGQQQAFTGCRTGSSSTGNANSNIQTESRSVFRQ